MKVALLTLGCRVNQSESSVIEGTLKKNDVTIVNLSDNPDYCIINTCTVTAKSDYNSRQLIRKALKTGAKVIVTGCYSQLRAKEVKAISGLSEIIENEKKYEIINILTHKQAKLFFGNYSRSRPYLKVQDGCNFSCSYCSVPLARGRSRSVPPEHIIERAQIIEAEGYNEIVLTGIHLGTYGRDLREKTNLNALLKKILLTTGIYRIRLSSMEINEIDDEFMELLQEDRVCKHLHLPLQSGSNKILRLMKRNYTAEYFSEKVEKIALKTENISLGTDVIVGFPEEGEDDFSHTFDLISRHPFAYLHIFPFSARPLTKASLMINRPSNNTVKDRMGKIIGLNKKKRCEYMYKQLNKPADIIIEERINGEIVSGTSNNYLKIAVISKEYIKGSVVIVRPTKIKNDVLEGIVIGKT